MTYTVDFGRRHDQRLIHPFGSVDRGSNCLKMKNLTESDSASAGATSNYIGFTERALGPYFDILRPSPVRDLCHYGLTGILAGSVSLFVKSWANSESKLSHDPGMAN